MKSLGIIPARFESSRFPGKPLVEIGGKTMIQRVYEQCQKASTLTEVIVATDDTRIFDHVIAFGGKVKMTASHHLTGTDRIAEVAASMEDFEIIVNIQGDEPFTDRESLKKVISVFETESKSGFFILLNWFIFQI